VSAAIGAVRACARSRWGRPVRKDSKPSEMIGHVFGRDGCHRQPEVAADGFGDAPNRDTFFTDRVQDRPGRRRFQRQAEDLRGVAAMHRGPAIRPVTRVRRDAFLARDRDQPLDEAVITLAVHGRWQSHHRDPHPAAGQRLCRFF
jgi:hypothetical protein